MVGGCVAWFFLVYVFLADNIVLASLQEKIAKLGEWYMLHPATAKDLVLSYLRTSKTRQKRKKTAVKEMKKKVALMLTSTA